jgi:virginiamycin B lyase
VTFAAILLGLIAVVLVPSACDETRHSALEQSAIRLPGEIRPQEVAIAGDGSVWAVDEYHGVVQRNARGQVRSFDLASDEWEDDWASDIVRGPDGAIWFATTSTVGRIDHSGRLRKWSLPRSAFVGSAATAGEAVWFSSDGPPGRIWRVTPAGTLTTLTFRTGRTTWSAEGLAYGPDGAFWLTLRTYGDGPDAIARVTEQGGYRSWPIRPNAQPFRIVAGPDGALWFTEQGVAAIGRITTAGEIEDFSLQHLVPSGIVAGPDGALWFAAQSCLGRITTAGAVATWTMRGAKTLNGIAAAQDGTFWLADTAGQRLYRVVPPGGPIRAVRRCGAPKLTRRSGATSATLTYRRLDVYDGTDTFTDGRIAISRRGRRHFEETFPQASLGDQPFALHGDTDRFRLLDLDGDGEPEIDVRLNSNGPHCCTWERVYRYDPARRTYVGLTHFWGNNEPKLKDVDGDGTPEFVYWDDRFSYDFCGYAGSLRPIQIWSYQAGRFHNVTKRYPRLIARDARDLWRLYLESRGRKDGCVQGILPAWAADQYLLGRGEIVWPTLERARRQGYLAPTAGAPGGSAYIAAVMRLLRKLGYVR